MPADTFTPIPAYQPEANEDYMSAAQKAHFRALLETWKQQLIDESMRTVHHMQDEHANVSDPNDRASQEEEFSIELRARDRERKLLRKIDSALQRLTGDDYGYCENCGIEIGIRRLEARPTAELCIDCKQLQERQENHRVA